MPVLEAGLAGIEVISTDVPAAEEIGGEDVMRFSLTDSPDHVADLILSWADCSPAHRLRRRVRQQYTWQAIFQREIKPMLQAGAPS
jgi:glycosyltransferase involved in cell wall biosynthesis